LFLFVALDLSHLNALELVKAIDSPVELLPQAAMLHFIQSYSIKSVTNCYIMSFCKSMPFIPHSHANELTI